MNVLFGLVEPDAGTILLRGAAVPPDRPERRDPAGIGMVHQHFMLVPTFTVVENVVLGQRADATGWRSTSATARAELREPRASATASRSTRTPWCATCRSACSSASRS